MPKDADAQETLTTPTHLPSLLVAICIMLVSTIYPLIFARQDGSADHGLAFALFWAMSAGLVRGVGFVPRTLIWKVVFSGGSCLAGLIVAALIRWAP